MEGHTEKIIDYENLDDAINVFGNCDENVKILENAFNVKIVYREAASGFPEKKNRSTKRHLSLTGSSVFPEKAT